MTKPPSRPKAPVFQSPSSPYEQYIFVRRMQSIYEAVEGPNSTKRSEIYTLACIALQYITECEQLAARLTETEEKLDILQKHLKTVEQGQGVKSRGLHRGETE